MLSFDQISDQRAHMATISVAEAKAQLSELINRAESGEQIVITRHGRPVAQLTAAVTAKKPIRSLAEFRARMPRLRKPMSETLREMRDEDL
jgi:prevent-host-death family protein